MDFVDDANMRHPFDNSEGNVWLIVKWTIIDGS